MKPSSFEVRALLLLLWLISDACGIKTGNFPCVHRNELGSDHPPSSVSFSDVSSQIGLNERQCEVRTSPNCLFPQYDNKLRDGIRGVFAWKKLWRFGGACVGDAVIDDLYYPRLTLMYIVDKMEILKTRLTIEFIASEKQCHFGDFDNDGDLDVFVGE